MIRNTQKTLASTSAGALAGRRKAIDPPAPTSEQVHVSATDEEPNQHSYYNPYQGRKNAVSCESLFGVFRGGSFRGRAQSCRSSDLINLFVFLCTMAICYINYTQISHLEPVVQDSANHPSSASNYKPIDNMQTVVKDSADHISSESSYEPADNVTLQTKTQTKAPVFEPPTPIELFATSDEFVRQRHTCIKAVRDKQLKLFSEILDMKGTEKPSPLLVDPAYHGNVGDTMLTVGELQLVNKSLGLGWPQQCHYNQARHRYPLCTDVLRGSSPNDKTKVAMWHAGGNWGNLWRGAQTVRISSMKTILQNGYKLVGLPQSLFYSSSNLKKKDVKAIKRSIALGLGLADDQAETTGGRRLDETDEDQEPSKSVNTSKLDTSEGLALAHSRVVFTWREEGSYEEAKQLYPFVRNMLVPDMAFQLGPYKAIRRDPKKQVDVLMFLRADKESRVKSKRNGDAIRQLLPKADMTFRVVDWGDRLKLFGNKNIYFTDTAIRLVSLGKVVVCDRLHAALLAYVSGVPFVYTDQVSGKITKTLGGAFKGLEDCMDGEKAMWARASSLEEALQIASKMIDRHHLGHGETEDGFS